MIERRNGKRFRVKWPVRVEGIDDGGASFTQNGVLKNISSQGALLLVERPLPTGARLDVYISLPTKGRKWMKYSASVVRVHSEASLFGAAVRFDSPEPEFAAI
ncbi:MAG TPA: PilZ domain-containing protein [Blastocatellia bacterium]|nr:PilZ domain-containing protein [Blastocatellia bacterium]